MSPESGRPGQWQERVIGDRYPFSVSDRSTNALGFVVLPLETTTYFLRLKTSSSSILHVQALPLPEASHKDAALVLFQVLYLAFMCSVLLWAVYEWQRGRERVMAAFALYQVSNVFFSMALMGYGAPFAPSQMPELMDKLTSLLVFSTTGTGFVFHCVTLGLYAPHRVLLRGLWVLAAWIPLEMVLYLSGHARLSLQINSLVVLLSGVLMLSLALSAREDRVPSRKLVKAVYALHTVSIFATMLPFLGWIDAIEWSMQSTLVHGLISAALMSWMLYQRARLMRRADQERATNAALTEQKLRIQTEHLRSQQQFIDVLTHELKTPIGVAMMSLAASDHQEVRTDRVRRALINLDSIVERTRLSALADSHSLQAQMASCNVSVLLYECIDSCRAPDRIEAHVGFELETFSDAQLLTLILTNLLDNALKYSPPDSKVDVSLARSEGAGADGLRLSVGNQIGAAGAPDASKVFGKYYRSPGAYSYSGSGLGLYLCFHLSQLIGAQLQYVPSGERIEFTLFIPPGRPRTI